MKRSLMAVACVAICCMGNDYPAKAVDCKALTQSMLKRAQTEVGLSNRVWESLRSLDKYILQKNGCDPISSGFLMRSSGMRLNYMLNSYQ